MATQPQPPFYVPKPPDDQLWTGQPYQMDANAPSYLSASFLLKSRAITQNQQVNYDEGAVWQAQSYQMNSDAIGILTSQKMFGVGGQIPTKNWVSQYTHDDSSLQGAIYQAAPRQSEPIRITTTQLKMYGLPGQVWAKNWATIHHYDETGPWDSRPLHSFTIFVNTTLPIFFGQFGQVPSKNWKPIYDYDDPGVWNEFSVPRSSPVLRPLLTVGGQPATKVWGQVYVYDDHSLWGPRPGNTLTFLLPPSLPLEFVGQKYWHNYYDEDVGWVRVPRGGGAEIGVPFPIAATRWLYDYDETGPWDARSKLSAIIFYPLPGEAFIAKFWKNDYDEGGFWSSNSKGEPTILLPNFTAQVKPAFYSPRPPDDQPYVVQPFQLGADSIVILASHTLFGAGGQVVTKHWEYNYDYDETGPWAPSRIVSGAIISTLSQSKFFGQSGQSPTKDWAPQLTYDDPSFWQGQPLSSMTIYEPAGISPRIPRFWRLDIDDSSAWLAQPISSYLTRQTFKQPFFPNFFEYIDDPAFWQGGSRGYGSINLPGGASPNIPRFWRYDYDETGAWQPVFTAKAIYLPPPPFSTPVLWRLNATYQDDQAFYVAQSIQFNADILQQLSLPGQAPTKKWSQWQQLDDPSFWQGVPTSSAIIPILTFGGYPAGDLWDWDHDNTSWWEARPLSSPPIAIYLTIGGQPPTKVWTQSYTLDDPAFWQGQPTRLNLLAKPNFLPFTPIQWEWNYDEGGLYVAQSNQFNSDILQVLVEGGTPFRKLWTWDFDDSAPWTAYHALGSTAGLHQILAANKPFFDNIWQQNYDEAAPWLAAPLHSVVLAGLLTVGGQPPTRRWEAIYDYDDPGPWNEFAAPRSSAVLRPILTSSVPKIPVFWKNDIDEASVWLSSPIKSRILATTFPSQTPIVPRQWVNPLDDPSIWLAQPIPSGVPELFATATVPLRARYWKYDFDETAPWPSAPQKIGGVVATQVVTSGNVPFYTEQQWYYTNDDPPPWTIKSSGIPPIVTWVTRGGQPPTRRWEPVFDYDDPGPWNEFAVPRSSAVLRPLLTGGTPFHKLWTWDFDEGGLWIPKIPTNFQLVNPLLPFGTSIFRKLGQFTQDDSSVWSGQPLLSPTLRPILTTGGQPPTRRWEPILRYDVDAAAWETTRRENLILLTTPIPKAVVPRQWRWDHMIDEPLWQKGPTSAWMDMLILPPPIPVNIDRLLLNYGTRRRSLANNHSRVRLLANTRPRRDET